jgi:hypothetical protein
MRADQSSKEQQDITAYSVYICPHKTCQKYLSKPVTLPCGFMCCKEHVETRSSHFECEFCQETHPIPDKNGFAINQMVNKVLLMNKHLSGQQHEAKQAFDQLERYVQDCKLTGLVDPDTFLYEYFFEWRNRVDLHREQLIQSIHKRSDEILAKLAELEAECNRNKATLTKISVDEIAGLDEMAQTLRMPTIQPQDLTDLLAKLNSNLESIRREMEEYKSGLLMKRKLVFVPSFNSRLVGDLRVIQDGEEKVLEFSNGRYQGQVFKDKPHGFGK